MNDPRSDFEIKMQVLTAPLVESGYFSHVYAECGLLDQDNARFCYRFAPDGADIFDLASLTKALVTSPLVFKQAFLRELDLFAPLDEFCEMDPLDVGLRKLRAFDLLCHRGGLPFWTNFFSECQTSKRQPRTRSRHVTEVLNRTVSRLADPRSELYSDLGMILLGYCLEQRLSQPLDAIFQKFLLDDLKASKLCADIGFQPTLNHKKTRFVPTGYCAIRKRWLQGEVHDENCWSLDQVSGHAGLFSSGEALSEFLKRLYRHWWGWHFFKTNHALLAAPGSALMGLRKGDDSSSQVFFDGQAMGHMGFTGCAFWIDFTSAAYAILLTNRVISSRLSSNIKSYREQVFRLMNLVLSE